MSTVLSPSILGKGTVEVRQKFKPLLVSKDCVAEEGVIWVVFVVLEVGVVDLAVISLVPGAVGWVVVTGSLGPLCGDCMGLEVGLRFAFAGGVISTGGGAGVTIIGSLGGLMTLRAVDVCCCSTWATSGGETNMGRIITITPTSARKRRKQEGHLLCCDVDTVMVDIHKWMIVLIEETGC